MQSIGWWELLWECETCGERLKDIYNVFQDISPAPKPPSEDKNDMKNVYKRIVTIPGNPAVRRGSHGPGYPATPDRNAVLSIVDEPLLEGLPQTQKAYLAVGYRSARGIDRGDRWEAEQLELPDLKSDRDLFYFLQKYMRSQPVNKLWECKAAGAEIGSFDHWLPSTVDKIGGFYFKEQERAHSLKSQGYTFELLPGWKIEGEGLCAQLTRSVESNELLHYLKHPECASSTSSRILQQIPRKMGKPAPQDAVNKKLHGIFVHLEWDMEQSDALFGLAIACVVLFLSSLLLKFLDVVQRTPA